MKYKIALVQHPMYFLIKEDTICAERTPPWGAPDIESYIQRVRENLAVLTKYPQLKLGYEWSALELELLKQDAPEVFEQMLSMIKAGKSALYNGTYSQPHLQTLSSEANYRQFEVGMKVYDELCHQKIMAYAHQEASLNEQTPQLLKAFGIKFMPLPDFISTIVFEGGEFIFHGKEGTMSVQGSEFTQWRGLDGTLIDVYLKEPAHLPQKQWLEYQEVKGHLQVPPIVIETPDMISVNDEWVAERSKAEFSILDDVLPERLAKCPPRFQSRIYTNWSYIEGIRAEELSRNNFLAERDALRAEGLNALAFVLLNRQPDSTDAIWKTILATQHHDVYCFCAPELREKSVNWLIESQNKAKKLIHTAAGELMNQIEELEPGGKQIVVFNTTPHPVQSPVTVEVPLKTPAVVDLTGKAVPSQVIPVGPNSSQVTFLANSWALGYASYGIKQGGKAKISRKAVGKNFKFENPYYTCVVLPDGTVSSLKLKSTGEELLNTSAMRGNQLAGQDSTGLGLTHEGTFDVAHTGPSRRDMWHPVDKGPEIQWEHRDQASVLESPLGATLTLTGSLSAKIKTGLKISFYHELPRIDFEWSFDFDKTCIGSFFDDETKLRVHWPLNYAGDITHDISFGIVHSYEGRPFFPVSWVDISDGVKGFAYFHQGTIKHWVSDQMLVNLFAWGEYTDAIGNRLGNYRWPKSFDQRLNGHQVIAYAIYPHSGDWQAGDVVGISRSYVNPPIAMLKEKGTGELPSQLNLLQITNPYLLATAVKVEESQVLCRLYSVSSKPEPVSYNTSGLKPRGLVSLSGETLKNLTPFQIGKLLLEKG